MLDVQASLDACTVAWEAGLTEMKFFHQATMAGNWTEAESYRLRASANFEASMDAMGRAGRALAKMRAEPNQ